MVSMVFSLALVIATASVVGMAATATAQTAPEDRLGLGEETVDVSVEMGPADDKVAVLAGSGTPVGDGPATPTARKATPIPKAKPAARPNRTTTASSRAAAGSGWSTARVSWYGPGFYGNTMAGGGVLTESSMVVAHRSLAFGTRVQFEYNGRTATAVVMDRGPYVGGRTFDLGPGTAKALGFGGVGTVKYRILGR